MNYKLESHSHESSEKAEMASNVLYHLNCEFWCEDWKKLTPLDGHIAYQWITDTIVLESIFDFKILTSYPYD